MSIVINKYQAAYKQLNTAINLYFSGGDLVSVHTLAGAAHIILHDLIEFKTPNKSWESIASVDNAMKLGEFLSITRTPQNFLKHANNDPNDNYTLNEEDTEYLLFFIIQNLCELLDEHETLSTEASVYQLWFMASHSYPLNDSDKNEILKGIENMNKSERVQYGNKVLSQLSSIA